MTRLAFTIVDVFTSQRFGGNPLAVVTGADGLSAATMQRIAREFNFSESTFVSAPPADSAAAFTVRIFTPTREVPFAGHPNVGTAAVLAETGVFGDIGAGLDVVFDERAGRVPLRIESRGAGTWCELEAPETLSLGATWPAEQLATILGLAPDDVVTDGHPPQEASVGLPFLMVELASAEALARAKVDTAAIDAALVAGMNTDIHCYVRLDPDGDCERLDTRMFAPHDGVPEDPATGSANCALVGLLTALDARDALDARWSITQGVVMGRPSALEARTEKRGGAVTRVWIGGYSVRFAQGTLEA
ncbi:MAG: PhzF family phenazine biosynthesis protein [Pseudomonadota bacterium]